MPVRKPKTKEEQQIFDTLNQIDELAHKYGFVVFAVGGFCRDEYLGRPHTLESDIDLFAESYNGLKLAGLVAEHFKVPVDYSHRVGTANLTVNGVDFDFQANMKEYDFLPAIRQFDLPQNNFTFNILSRDFTVNTLVMSLRSGKLYDVTGLAKKDLTAGILRTPLDPNLTVPHDPIIILRALKFKNKYGYRIVPELRNAMLANISKVEEEIEPDKIAEMVQEILAPDRENGIGLLKQYGLERYIPAER